MNVGIITIFPEYFEGVVKTGMIRKAIENNLLDVIFENPRDYATDRYKSVDDYPYGGGSGMVMKYDTLKQAIENARTRISGPVIYMSPQGTPFHQAYAKDLAREEGFILVCGRYEGIDERLMSIVDEEISIGDFVLSGGEPAAAVVLDAVVRLVPGVLGDENSLSEESFEHNLLEYPQYTRPSHIDGMDVPDVLLSGHHGNIARWRLKERLKRTLVKRPDMLKDVYLSEEEKNLLEEVKKEILETLSMLGV